MSTGTPPHHGPATTGSNPSTAPERVVRTERISPDVVEALAALLDIEVPHSEGNPLPPMWHITHLLDRRKHRDIGPDGHPTSGIPQPPGEGLRRMFAGSRVHTFAPLVIGQEATRTTSVVSTLEKQGRTGPLTFITIRQEFCQNGVVRVVEEQDTVYRASGTDSLPPAPVANQPDDGPVLELAVDETLLFRFSALTYNAHRIHYDHTWVRHEGYDDLVIHGPLQALMMAEHLRRHGVNLVGRTFAYRLISPMIGPQTLRIVPGPHGLAHGVESRSAAGAVCATSTVTDIDAHQEQS